MQLQTLALCQSRHPAGPAGCFQDASGLDYVHRAWSGNNSNIFTSLKKRSFHSHLGKRQQLVTLLLHGQHVKLCLINGDESATSFSRDSILSLVACYHSCVASSGRKVSHIFESESK